MIHWSTPPDNMDDAIREIRFSLVQALSDAQIAKTKLDRAASFREAYAFAGVLKMLKQFYAPWPTGVANSGRFYSGEIAAAVEWLSGDTDDLLGLQKELVE